MVQLGTNGNSHLIAARDVAKTYRRGSEELHVLQGVNLAVDKGEFVAFMGPSGSGKTTLLNLLGGLDVPSAGSIWWRETRSRGSAAPSSRPGARATSGSCSRCTT